MYINKIAHVICELVFIETFAVNMENEGNFLKKVEVNIDIIASAMTNFEVIRDEIKKYTKKKQSDLLSLVLKNNKLSDQIAIVDEKILEFHKEIDIKNVKNEYSCWVNDQFRSKKYMKHIEDSYQNTLDKIEENVKSRLELPQNVDTSIHIDKFTSFTETLKNKYQKLEEVSHVSFKPEITESLDTLSYTINESSYQPFSPKISADSKDQTFNFKKIEIIQIPMGSKYLTFNGFLYKLKNAESGHCDWLCVKKSCSSLAITDSFQSVLLNNPAQHTHLPKSQEFIDKKIKLIKSKSIALDNNLLPAQSIPSTSRYCSLDEVRDDNISSNVFPTSIKLFVIPSKLSITLCNENFVLYDSGVEDPERFIVFGTQRSVTFLSGCSKIYIISSLEGDNNEGLYVSTICAKVENNIIPMLFIIRVASSPQIFTNLWLRIQSITGVDPSFAICNFDKPSIDAFKTTFPNCKCIGSFYHFVHAIWKKMKVYHLKSNESVKIYIKMLLALAFCPVSQVTVNFQLVVDDIHDESVLETITPFLKYFARTFIGPCSFSVEDESLFSLIMWNQYERVLDKTNHDKRDIEGWDDAFHFKTIHSKSNLLSFLKMIQKEQMFVDSHLDQIQRGEIYVKKKRNYRLFNCKIRNIAENYNNTPELTYLKSIAEAINF